MKKTTVWGGYADKTDTFTIQFAIEAHETSLNKGQKDVRVRMPSRRLFFSVYSGEATLVKKKNASRDALLLPCNNLKKTFFFSLFFFF